MILFLEEQAEYLCADLMTKPGSVVGDEGRFEVDVSGIVGWVGNLE